MLLKDSHSSNIWLSAQTTCKTPACSFTSNTSYGNMPACRQPHLPTPINNPPYRYN
jgi:hypothetical protein